MSENPTDGSAMSADEAKSHPTHIYLVSFPKIIFLYPSLIAAIVCGILLLSVGNTQEISDKKAAAAATESETADAETSTETAEETKPVSKHNEVAEIATLVFLMIFAANIVVISFDFPRTTSLTFFFVGVAAFMGVWLLSNQYPDLFPLIGKMLGGLQPFANAQFYFIFSAIFIVIYIAVFISVQFDYWEVRPNELLHHHGVLSDLERFSAPNLRITKEINDLFEYVLLRSGRLILHPSNERRAIVLENIFFINRKEEQITKMLGALQVQVRSDDNS